MVHICWFKSNRNVLKVKNLMEAILIGNQYCPWSWLLHMDINWLKQLEAWSTAMAQPVETTTILNAPWDVHSMMFFKSVADLCFTEPFAVLGKPSTNIDHSAPVWTYGWILPNVHGIKTQFSPFDLELWPTTLTYNPNLAKVNVDPHAKNQGRRSNGSNRRTRTNKQTNKRTLPNVLSPLLRGR